MNPRERILAVFNGETPDRVPWFGDLTWWVNSKAQHGGLPSELLSDRGLFYETLLEFHREFNVGLYFGPEPYPFEVAYDDTVQVTNERRGPVARETIETPVGTLVQEHTSLPDAGGSRTMRQVKSPADLRTLRYLVEHSHYEPKYEPLLRRYPQVQELGIVHTCLPKTPALHLMTDLAGIQIFVDLWLDARAELEETIEVMDQKYGEGAEVAVESPAEFVWSPATLSSETVGETFFEMYVAGYLRKWVGRLRETGKRSAIHMDGTLRGLIAQTAAIGYDAIEAVTPQPVGDITLQEARELVGPDTILWGGIPSVFFTPLVDDDQFEQHVREVLSVMTGEPRYVLGSADQVPPTAHPQRILRVAELVERYGAYTT